MTTLIRNIKMVVIYENEHTLLVKADCTSNLLSTVLFAGVFTFSTE